jgi:general stress protein 26
MNDASPTSDAKKITSLLEDFRFGMFTTLDSGKPVARPFTIQEVEPGGDLWFLVSKRSTAVQQLAADSRAGVALSSNDSWVSLTGTARVVDSQERVDKYWSPVVEAWFPDGKEDPEITVLKFSADGGEYWDTPGSRVATALAFVKAKVTGEPLEGDSGKVDL